MNTIIIILIILLAILLYLKNNKKENFVNYTGNLVITTVGDNSKFDELWTGKNRNYHIWVIYNGDDDNKYNQYKNSVEKNMEKKRGKIP